MHREFHELLMLLAKPLSDLPENEIDDLINRAKGLQEVEPAVESIIEEVRHGRDSALRDITERFDGVRVSKIEVERKEIDHAYDTVSDETIGHFETAISNIRSFHELQKEEELRVEIIPGVNLGRKSVPLNTVGVYVPGGRAPYPSTALMGVIPAVVSGVEHVIVCTPPDGNGRIAGEILVAVDMAGAERTFKVGGAQAVAAMAYGTETVPKVEKVVGPGNVYVTAAKSILRGVIDIDMPAGPSEVLIVADESARPEFIACDLLSQVEHGPGTIAVLVSTSQNIAERVIQAIEQRSSQEDGLKSEGVWILLASNLDEAFDFSNRFAPEHLEIMTFDPEKGLDAVINAGSVFLGDYSPVAIGDYVSGTNHILPTAGYARVYSGLSISDFLKKITFQRLTKEGLLSLKDAAVGLSKIEGFKAHTRSITERLKDQ